MPAPPDPVIADVVLPVLDEAEAIPQVLAGLPAGYRAIVVDNGSTDGSAAVARAHGALVVHEPRRGFGAACWAGLGAATADVVAFMDCDGSFAGHDLPAVVDPVRAGTADLVLGARHAAAGAWPPHARLANRVLATYLRRVSGVPVTDLGPMRAARRPALLALGMADRGFGWPLEMVLRAVAAGWRIEEVPVGYAPRIGRSKVTGTVRGTVRAVRDMSRVAARLRPPARPSGTPVEGTVLVIAKAPRPGFGKTRLTPPCTPEQAAALATAALADTLAAVAACPVARRVLVLDGEAGPWLPAGFEVIPQRGDGLDERLANAFADVARSGSAVTNEAVTAPMLLVGMDTPQVTPALIEAALARLTAPGVDAVLGGASDGGWWAIGLHRADAGVFRDVPMSRDDTGERQRARLHQLGLRVAELPGLRDVDRWDDACAVAALVPHRRFGRAVAAVARHLESPPAAGAPAAGAAATGASAAAP